MYQSILRDPGSEIVSCISNVEVVNGSILLVPAGRVAYFVLNGHISEPYHPGRYSIATGVSPFFVRLRNLMTLGDPAVSVAVFYVSTHIVTDAKLGTGVIIFRDKRFNLSMQALSSLTLLYEISNPLLLLQRIVGMYRDADAIFEGELETVFTATVMPFVRDQISEHLRQSDVDSVNLSLPDLSRNLFDSVSMHLAVYGLRLVNFAVTAINIDEEDLKRLRERETTEADATIRLNTEKAVLTNVYGGDINKRIMDSIATGTLNRGQPWGISDGSNSANTQCNSGVIGPMLQIMMMSQLLPELRESMAGMVAPVNPPNSVEHRSNDNQDDSRNNGSRPLPPRA